MLIAGTRIPLWMAVDYLLALLPIICWFFYAPTSFMAFDDPASHRTAAPYLYVACAICYPILPLSGVPCSFLAYRRSHKKLAYFLAGISLLPLAVVVLQFVILFVILAIETISLIPSSLH